MLVVAVEMLKTVENIVNFLFKNCGNLPGGFYEPSENELSTGL